MQTNKANMEKTLTESERIAEGNELIAVFMGYERYEDNYGVWFKTEELIISMHPKLEDLKYHTSWDWLMPVVQRIVNADMDTFDSYALWVSDSLRTADIKQVYVAVVNYIEQDNPRN